MDIVRKEPQRGWIEVVAGSMFSGKSEELIRRLRRAQIARQKVQIFKPLVDDRYGDDHIVSHSDMRIASRAVRTSDELLQLVDDDTEVVGVDEGQFFDMSLPAVCSALADRGKRVIVAGLDQDEDARHLRRLRQSGEPYAASRREQRPRARRRERPVRSAVPPLLRSKARGGRESRQCRERLAARIWNRRRPLSPGLVGTDKIRV